MKVLVCGDRNWGRKEVIALRLRRLPRDTVIIHGAARGADRLAGEVAASLGFEVQEFPAQWNVYGKAAGVMRNSQMLDTKPDLVIAFHVDLAASRGTKHCVAEARKRGISVEVITGNWM